MSWPDSAMIGGSRLGEVSIGEAPMRKPSLFRTAGTRAIIVRRPRAVRRARMTGNDDE